MDGLEDRVRRALGAGALGADPSLVDLDAVHAGVAARRRRRLAVVSTAGVMALLVVGAVALNRPDSRESSGVLGEPTPTATSGDRVPWLALPPPPDAFAQTTPTAVPTARDCRGQDLAFAGLEPDGAAGTLYNVFLVKNVSTSECTLSGSPAISVAGSKGGDIRHDSAIFGGVKPATIGPNETARVALATSVNCPGATVDYTNVALILKDGYPVATHQSLHSTCSVLVGDWFTETPATPEPYAGLSASIEGAPLAVDPGTTLDHTVVLTNNGPDDVTLPTPCPAYREYITDGRHTTDVSYGLNCAGWKGVIPAGESVRLQMKLDIPAGITTPVKFFWILESLPANLLLTADGLHSPPTIGPSPTPVATSSAQPAGEPQVTLFHCGVNQVSYDGATWEVINPPFDATNAPATFSGFGRFQRDGDVLHFVDQFGTTIDFTVDDGVAGPPCV